MQCVNIVNSKNIQRQRYNYLSKIGFYIRKAIMIVLLIFILFLILQQNQVWYVKWFVFLDNGWDWYCKFIWNIMKQLGVWVN